MSQALATYSGDRRAVISLGEFIRKPNFGSNWTHIRIGLLGSFVNVSASITGTSRLVWGVCSGQAAGYSADSSAHVLGIRTAKASMVYTAGPPAYVAPGTSSGSTDLEIVKRIGTTVTTTALTNIGVPLYVSAATSVRSALFAEITKGSPNFTLEVGGPTNAIGVQTDLTEASMIAMMEGAALTDISSINANYNAWSSGTLAVNESDGTLDNVFVHWNRTSMQYSWEIYVKKFS